jgi:hypothetical protein
VARRGMHTCSAASIRRLHLQGAIERL